MKKMELVVIVVAFAAALIAVAGYVAMFHNTTAGGVEQWGQFGDYLGGVVNPIVGLATVVLVVITLRVTRDEADFTRKEMAQQLDHLRKQAILGDMHKRLEGLMAEWERRVTETAPANLQRTSFGTKGVSITNMSIREMLEDGDFRKKLLDRRAAHNGPSKFFESSLTPIAHALVPLLSELIDYCQEYENASSNFYLTGFYKKRVRTISENLCIAGHIEEGLAENLIDIQDLA